VDNVGLLHFFDDLLSLDLPLQLLDFQAVTSNQIAQEVVLANYCTIGPIAVVFIAPLHSLN
jgi:hypothetical protein